MAASAVMTCPATTRARRHVPPPLAPEDMSQPPLAPDRAELRARRGWPSRLAGQCPLTRHLKDPCCRGPGGESISTHLGETLQSNRRPVVLVRRAPVVLLDIVALASRAIASRDLARRERARA